MYFLTIRAIPTNAPQPARSPSDVLLVNKDNAPEFFMVSSSAGLNPLELKKVKIGEILGAKLTDSKSFS